MNTDKKTENQTTENSGTSTKYENLVVHSAEYKTLLTTKYKNRKKWTPVNEKHEVSVIPGSILELYVRDGEMVKKGQPLLILEAMKMENTIFSPINGIVKKVNVKVGEILPKGTILIEYA